VHAEFVWDGGSWQVQDLGSRNGTFVNGRKLDAGEQAALPCGAELVFGMDARFRLVDDSPPQLMAFAESGRVALADGEILCLPSLEAGLASIFPGLDDRWEIETDDGTRPIEDQETVVVDGEPWRVSLPSHQTRTQDSKVAQALTLDDVELDFSVSRDEEHVDMTLHTPGQDIELEPRAHAYLLLLLARCRQDDAKQEGLPESEHGWVHREELLKMLAIDVSLLNLWVYRARQQLAQAGIRGAGGIIKRRTSTQQLRLATSKIKVQTA